MALHVPSLERIFFCFFVVFMCLCVIASWSHFFSLNWITSITVNLCFACLLPHHCLLCAYFTYLLLARLLRTYFACLLLVTCLLPTCYMLPICLLSTFASFACHAYFCLLTYFCHCHLLASMSWFRYQTPTSLFHHLFACFELQACPLAWYFPLTYLCKR